MAQTVPIEVVNDLLNIFQASMVVNIFLGFILVFMVIVVRGVPWRLGVARLRRRAVILIPRANNKFDLLSIKKYAGAFVENLKTNEVFQIVPQAFSDFGGIMFAISHELAGLTLQPQGFALIQMLKDFGVHSSQKLFDFVDSATRKIEEAGMTVLEPPPDMLPKLEYKSGKLTAKQLMTTRIYRLTYFHAIIGFFINQLKIPSARELKSKLESSALSMTGENKGNTLIKGAVMAGLIMVFAALAAGIAYNMTATTQHPVVQVQAPPAPQQQAPQAQPPALAPQNPPPVQPPQQLPGPPKGNP